MLLSKQVEAMEEELRSLRACKAKTLEIVSIFINNYDDFSHEFTMPADRSCHTLPLKNLLLFISEPKLLNFMGDNGE